MISLNRACFDKENLVNVSEKSDIINCFTIDVEGFVESNLESFFIEEKYINRDKENYEIEKNTNCLLELLDDLGIKATFFFLGRIAKDIPHLVREAAQSGHEIACHSYEHCRIFRTSRNEFKEKLANAKNTLEDISGIRVYGFRAPDFSITNSSVWALDVLKEIDFVYDSSIYPIDLHDVYGIKEIDPVIHKLQNGLIEFPLSSIGFLKKRFPFGGGGYFRLYPLFLTKMCIAKTNRLGYPCMFYVHPYEVGPVIPKISGLSTYRKFRHYFNCSRGIRRLKEIFHVFKFGPAVDILKRQGLIGG